MKIAAAQISCAPGDLAANLGKVRDFSFLAKDAGAEPVVFPEMVDTGYSMPIIQKHATLWGEGVVPELQKLARQLSIAITSGVSERDGKFIYNAQVLVDAKGKSLQNTERRTWLRLRHSMNVDASHRATNSPVSPLTDCVLD